MQYPVLEMIRSRRSVRTFDPRPIESGVLSAVESYMAQCRNPFGAEVEFRLLSAKEHGLTSPVIVGADTYLAGKVRPGPHAELGFGYAFEDLLLYAQSLGLGTVWLAGTLNRPAFEKALELQSGERMPAASPLGYPAARRSLRETLMRRGIQADERLPFSQLFFDGGFDAPLSEDSPLSEPLGSVRLAPSAVNKQPWRAVVQGPLVHFFEKHSRGYAQPGYDLQKVDMGIALAHFDLTLQSMGRSCRFSFEDPGLPLPQDTEYIVTCEL